MACSGGREMAHRALWGLQGAAGYRPSRRKEISHIHYAQVMGNIWLQLGHDLLEECTNVLERGGHENTNNLLGPRTCHETSTRGTMFLRCLMIAHDYIRL